MLLLTHIPMPIYRVRAGNVQATLDSHQANAPCYRTKVNNVVFLSNIQYTYCTKKSSAMSFNGDTYFFAAFACNMTC